MTTYLEPVPNRFPPYPGSFPVIADIYRHTRDNISLEILFMTAHWLTSVPDWRQFGNIRADASDYIMNFIVAGFYRTMEDAGWKAGADSYWPLIKDGKTVTLNIPQKGGNSVDLPTYCLYCNKERHKFPQTVDKTPGQVAAEIEAFLQAV